MKYAVLWLISLILTAFIIWLSIEPEKIEKVKYKPSYVHVPIVKPTQPETVTIYQKADTVFRAKIIEGPIIVKVHYRDRFLNVSTIDTKGIIQDSEYKLPAFAYTVDIDTAGNVKVKRKVLPRVAIALGCVGLGIASFFVGKKLIQ
jgi:hypothetical protein